MVYPPEMERAAFAGDTAALQRWFKKEKRGPGDFLDVDGQSLMNFATRRGRTGTMRFLLDQGAKVEGDNASVETPLYVACRFGRHAAAVLLLDRGARIEIVTRGPRLETPLICAASHGFCDMIRLLLHRGADLNAPTIFGVDVFQNAEEKARPRANAPVRRDHMHRARHDRRVVAADFLKSIRLAGGWRAFVRYPRFRLLMLRLMCARGRAHVTTDPKDALLWRLFPAPPPKAKRTRAARRARTAAARKVATATPLPDEVFWLIVSFWRCDRDYDAAAPDADSDDDYDSDDDDWSSHGPPYDDNDHGY